jgi:PilZ domain
MRSAQAFQIEPGPADALGHDRRTPAFSEDLGPPSHQESTPLRWPGSWPATLYADGCGAACRVQSFSALGAQIAMPDPPPVGAEVALKFPFTIYLKGRVAWSRGDDLGIDFDEDAQRSARIVEDVLLDKTGG